MHIAYTCIDNNCKLLFILCALLRPQGVFVDGCCLVVGGAMPSNQQPDSAAVNITFIINTSIYCAYIGPVPVSSG